MAGQIQKRFIKAQLPAIIDAIRRNVHNLKLKVRLVLICVLAFHCSALAQVNKFGVIPTSTREYVRSAIRTLR